MDDLSDLQSAYGSGGTGWTAPSAPPVGRAALMPGVLTVTPGPMPSATGGATLAPDDLSDLHAAFGKTGFSPPAKSVTQAAGGLAADVAESAASGLVRGVVGAPAAPASMAETAADSILNAGEYGIRKLIGQGKSYHDIAEATKAAKAKQAAASIAPLPSVTDLGASAQQALTPYLHTPTSIPGQFAETAGEFAPLVAANPASLAGMGTVAGAAGTLAGHVLAPAVGSEAAGQVADRYAPDFSELARLGGGFAGGAAYGAGAAGLDAAAHTPAVAKAIASTPGLGDVGKGLQETIAARTIAKNASDLPALAQNLAPSFAGDQPVPGFNPTTFQLTGDQGLGNLERAASRSAAHAPDYTARQGEQQSAQNAAVGSTMPQGDISYVPNAIQAHLDAIDQRAQDHVSALQEHGRNIAQAAGIDAGGTPDQAGADLRGHLDTANQAARAHEKTLWDAVDPDGTLAHAMAPVQDAFGSIYGDGNLPKADAANLTPFEKSLSDLIPSYGLVEPFRELQSLKSNLAGAMREELSTKGRTTAYGRMKTLMGPVQETINKVVARHVETEGHQVAQGSLDFDQTAVSRLRDRYGVAGADDAAGVSGRTGTDARDVPGAGAEPGAGAGGAGDAPASGPRPIEGDPGASARPATADETAPRVTTPADPIKSKPQSLVNRLQAMGGVRDEGGNLKAMGFDRFPGLITRNGIPLDRARESVAQEGYLGHDTEGAAADTSVNDLLDKIGQHPTYSIHDEERVDQRAARADEIAHQKRFAFHRDGVLDTLAEHGVEPDEVDERLLNRATYHHMDGLPAAHAYELALTRDMMHDGEAAHAAAEETPDLKAHFDEIGRSLGEHGELDTQRFGGAEARDGDRGAGAGAASAPDGEEPRGAGEAVGQPDEAASGRLRAANAATRERAETYKNPLTKGILAPGQRAGEFRMLDSKVPEAVLRNGPAGYDAVKAYLKGTKNSPESIAALRNTLTARLREKALSGDGLIRQDGLDKWKQQHQHVLRALGEVDPGFAAKFDDPAKASAAVMDATRAHAQALADFRKSAAGKMLGLKSESEVVGKVGQAIRGGASKVRDLLETVKADPDAQAGLRAAGGEWLRNLFTSPLEAGTTGERATSGRAYLKALGQHREALSELLTPEQMAGAGRLAKSYDQAQRSLTGSQVGSGSPTAQNMANRFFEPKGGAGGHAANGGLLFAAMEGANLGFEHGGVRGALVGLAPAVGGYMVKALRDAGLHDVREIVNDALMNPDRMRQLLARLPETATRADKEGAAALRRSFLASGAAEEAEHRQRAPAERIEPTMGPAVARVTGEVVASRRAIDPADLPHPAHDDRSADGRFANPEDTHEALRGALDQARSDVAAMVRAYHGTPHSFDRFDTSKIGTGEGAQVFGHGLYFAENEGVAKSYQTSLGEGGIRSRDGSVRMQNELSPEEGQAFREARDAGGFRQAMKLIRDMPSDDAGRAELDRKSLAVLQKWQSDGAALHTEGNLYKVAIDREPEHFLDYDVGLNQQSEYVKNAIKNDPEALRLYRQGPPGGRVYSHVMRQAGIAGIKYKDAGSRLGGVRDGSRNYVVFDHGDVTITHRNGEAMTPAERELVLAKMREQQAPRIEPTMERQAAGTLRDMLAQHNFGGDRAVDDATRASTMAVGARLSKIVGDMPVHVVDSEGLRAMAAGRLGPMAPGYEPAGFFDPQSNHIVVLQQDMADKATASRLLVHEGLHGALWHAINASEATRGIIDHLRSTATAIHFERGGEAEDHYGLKNAHEFVSEAMSNPGFQHFLASIPADERTVKAYGLDAAQKPSMWHVFTQAVRKIFGLPPGAHSYLDAAMKVTGHLLDQAEARTAPRAPAGASAAPPARRQATSPDLTDRAASLMPHLRDKAGEIIKGGGAPTASDFGKRVADSPALPALMSAALAPRMDGMDRSYQGAFRTLESKGLFSPQETALLDRETGRLRAAVKRAYPQASEADIAAMPPHALHAAAFADFANGRTEEGTLGENLHIGIRRAFERTYAMFQGLQSAGNRMGLYRPNDIYRDASGPTIAGLAPTMNGEALRAQQ